MLHHKKMRNFCCIWLSYCYSIDIFILLTQSSCQCYLFSWIKWSEHTFHVRLYFTWLSEGNYKCDGNDGNEAHGNNTARPFLWAYHYRPRLVHGPLVDHEATLIGGSCNNRMKSLKHSTLVEGEHDPDSMYCTVIYWGAYNRFIYSIYCIYIQHTDTLKPRFNGLQNNEFQK